MLAMGTLMRHEQNLSIFSSMANMLSPCRQNKVVTKIRDLGHSVIGSTCMTVFNHVLVFVT